jgi:hypothetical protein
MTRAVASSRKEELWIVREEVVSVEGGVDRSSSQSWDSVIMSWRHPFDVLVPVVPGYNPELFDNFGGRRAWVIVEVQGWRSWVWFVWRGCSWRPKEVEFLDGHFQVSDDEELINVGCRQAARGFAWVMERVEIGVVSKDLYDSMEDHSSWGLWGLVVLSRDKDTTMHRSRGGVEDVWCGISCLIVVTEHLYGNAEELSTPFSFVVAVVGFIARVEHRDCLDDVCGVYRHSLYLAKGLFIWGDGCGLTTRGRVVETVIGGRHERERMSLRSRSLLLLTVWTFPPWV